VYRFNDSVPLPCFVNYSNSDKNDIKGPVIFKQARVGLRGRQFSLFKFRTMIMNAEKLKKDLEADNEMDGPVFKIKDDPRVTPIGKFLAEPDLMNCLNFLIY